MHGLVLTYKSIFTGEEPDLGQVMARVPSRIAIEYFCFICCQLHQNPTNSEVQEKLLNSLVRRQPQEIQAAIWGKYQSYKAYTSTIIFDIYTGLQLLNTAVANFNPEAAPDSTPENELDVLVATLLVNERYNRGVNPYKDGDGLDLVTSMVWPIHVFSTELRLRKNYKYETYRGLMFSNFLADYPVIVNAYEELYGLTPQTLHNYPLEVFNFYGKNGYNTEREQFNSTFSMNLEELIPMLSEWILDLSNEPPANYSDADYRTLRSKPIIKLSENKYCVSNWNFILDKMYTGQLFDLYTNAGIRESYGRFDSFKGSIGESFSEAFSEDILRSACPDHTLIKGNPDQESNHDFYLRYGNKIALIENKDALFVKHGTYPDIKEELHKKIVDPKGLKQIVSILGKLAQNPFLIEPNLEGDIEPENLTIYPIVLVSDSTFIMTGMGDYLRREFRKLNSVNKGMPFRLAPPIILDVHTLINLHDSLALTDLTIFKLIEDFYMEKSVLNVRAMLSDNTQVKTAQFQGFVEVMGDKGELMDGGTNGSLLNKTMQKLRELGIPEE